MMKRIAVGSLFVMMLAAVAASAHHGTGISYDNSKRVTVSGVVTRFAFTNPHSQVYFDVKDEQGNVVAWAAELNAPGVLQKGGWTRRTIKPGDQITVTLNPSLAGTPVGNAVRALPLIVNGKEIPLGGRDID
jgi:hypothetical protein